MSSFYRIKGLPGLEGLVAETDEGFEASKPNELGLCSICSLSNPNTVLGDRSLKFPIPSGALYIGDAYLERIPDPNREYTSESPFGKFQFEGSFKRDDIEIDYSRYENGISVTVREMKKLNTSMAKKTVYSQNFYGGFADTAMDVIEAIMSGAHEIEDAVFQFKSLKDDELHTAND